MNALQLALRTGYTPERLSQSLDIAVKPHPLFPNLLLFKYSQVSSPMSDPVVQASRGIILDSANDWAVVSHTYDKFFNLGEPNAATIDWESAVAAEKLDGSLIQMFHYQGNWHVATSGTADAGGKVNGLEMTFAQLFWDTFHAQGLDLSDLDVPENDDERAGSSSDWTRFTFAWELCTPLNRVVVDNRDFRVTLIGIRDRVRGTEVGIYQGPAKWPKVRHFAVDTREGLLKAVQELDPLKQEGFVVVDKFWNRVKLKSEQYLALHHLRGNGNPTPKSALKVILAGETGEILASFPEWKPMFGEVQKRLDDMVSCLEVWYEECQARVAMTEMMVFTPAESQKAFAAHALKSPCSGALFSVRAGKAKNAEEALRKLPLDSLFNVLRLGDYVPEISSLTAVVTHGIE